MEYNPYTKKYNHLKQILENKNIEKKELTNELEWYNTTDISNLHFLLQGKEDDKNDTQLILTIVEKDMKELAIKLDKVKKQIKTFFNPLNWFDEKQKIYRKTLAELKKELDAKIKNKILRVTFLSKIDETINQYKQEIDKYKHFNIENIRDKIKNLDHEIVTLEKESKHIFNLKINVDMKLENIISQIKDFETNISTAKNQINAAKSFEQDLDSAENSYEKAMIHEKCEKLLGDGSPKKIIREHERILKKLEKDLEKAKKRATEIGEKASREIYKIIIDGNNMCYEGNEFVGLNPLIQATSQLQESYQIIVVFDSAIRSQLKANDETINNKFDKNIKIHIVASKKLADETILDIASENNFCYIISNDRFGEYKDKEAVINNRIIRHEIVDGHIIIHDLNVKKKYY